MIDQRRFRYCALPGHQRTALLQCSTLAEAKKRFAFHITSFPASATWAELKQELGRNLPGASADLLEVLLAYTDQADEGFAPVFARRGDNDSIGHIISHNSTYIAVCVKTTQEASQPPSAALPQPGNGTESPAAAVPGNANQPAATAAAEPAPTAALLAGRGVGTGQPTQGTAALANGAPAADQALKAASDAAAGAVSAPELLEACRQHSTPVHQPWRIPQPLLHSGLQAITFQQQGVAWMMARESKPGKVVVDVAGKLCTHKLPAGGILADAMGLGKTVQAILLMAGTEPTAPGPKPATDKAKAAAQQLRLLLGGSLVLVPKILLGQWVGELLLRRGSDPRVVLCEFTGTTKHDKGIKSVEHRRGVQPQVLAQAPSAEQLSTCHVVLMSYENFMSEQHRMKRVGNPSPLGQIYWRRVLLDESQRLGAGSSSGVCKAAAKLVAASRWCLSGTPFAANARVSGSILRFLYAEADHDWLRGMGPEAAERAATSHAVRSQVDKALDAAGRHAHGTAARAEQLQVAAQLLGPLLLRRELQEVQQQYPIPALHFAVNRIELVHAHGAVNGLLAAAARQALQEDGGGYPSQVSLIFSRAVRIGLHPQLPLYGSPSAPHPISLCGAGFFPDLLLEGPTPGTTKQQLAPMHALAALLADSAQLAAGMEATAAAQMLLQLALAGGAEGRTPKQLLQQAEELLSGPYMLPLSVLKQQHIDRVGTEHAAAGVEAFDAAAANLTSGFEFFKAAAGKYEGKWRQRQELLAKLLWQQLQIHDDAAASQQLTARYMEAAAAAGSTARMTEAFHSFVDVSAAVCDEVPPELAVKIDELPKDAAGWEAVLQGSFLASSAQEWASWVAHVKQASTQLTLSWKQLSQETSAAAQCDAAKRAAIMNSTTSNRYRSAVAAARKQALAAAADALLLLPADAAAQLRQAAETCKQQLMAFELVARCGEAHAAPSVRCDTSSTVAVSAAGPSAGISTAGNSHDEGAGPSKKQKRALHEIQGSFDVDAARSMTAYLRLYRAWEEARAKGFTTAALVDTMRAVEYVERAVSTGKQLLGSVEGILRVLAGARSVPGMVSPADLQQAAAAEHERRAEHLARGVKAQLLAVAAEARTDSRSGGSSLPDLRNRYGCVLAGLAEHLVAIKHSNAALSSECKQKVVVAVSDRHMMGQVQRLCAELEVPATNLEGKDAADKLRNFSLASSASWVIILRLGRQAHEQSAGLTLTCCSQLLVVDTLPREDLLRQLLGRIHRFGQQQEQRVTFFVGRGSVHEAMYDRLVKPTLDKLRSGSNFMDVDEQQQDVDEEREGDEQADPAAASGVWQDATDRLDIALRQDLLLDMARQSAWQLGAAQPIDGDD